jgi:hypothetical protein
LDAGRWLSDRAQALLGAEHHARVDLLREAAPGSRGGALVMAQRRSADGAAVAALPNAGIWLDDSAEPAWGTVPATFAVQWQGRYRLLRRWSK